jgi:hypothetical protein
MNDAAELMRLRYKYRRLIMEGTIRLPIEGAARLMGPDCAYHLYFLVDGRTSPAAESDPPPNPAKRSGALSQEAVAPRTPAGQSAVSVI